MYFVFLTPRRVFVRCLFVFLLAVAQLCIKEREGFATDLANDESLMSSMGKTLGGDSVAAVPRHRHAGLFFVDPGVLFVFSFLGF